MYVLYLQLYTKNVSLNDFVDGFNINTLNYYYLFLAIILMPLNWFLESIKWRFLVNVVQKKFELLYSIQSVLLGVFFGFITPNRIGEFGGRLYKIEKKHRVNSLNISVFGGVAQFSITFLVGMFSLVFGVYELPFLKIFLFFFFPFILILVLAVYFNFKRIIKFLFSFKYFRKFSKKYIFNFNIDLQTSIIVLIITFIRYCVYVFQYVFMMYFFGIDLGFIFLFKIVSVMLLIQTIIPSFALVDVGIRGSVLLFLLSQYIENESIILLAVLLVWILNLVLPAIGGYIIFLNLKTEENHEKSNNNNNYNS